MHDVDTSFVSTDEAGAGEGNRVNQVSTQPRMLLAGAVIGAALAYLFDPDRGAARRAILRDQVTSLLRSAGRDLNARARDVRNRSQGVLAEARTRVGDQSTDGDQWVGRVRAAVGHRVDRVRWIEVVAEGDRV